MKNYYEILEVNEKASKEVIEKAYKVLVKKYHPDLYENQTSSKFNKKIREINEAYEVLSDDFLREQYNLELQKEENMMKEKLKEQMKEQMKEQIKENKMSEQEEVEEFNNNMKKYKVGSFSGIINLVKELYKSKSKRQEVKEITKKDILAIVLTIITLIVLGGILWLIPFTNGWVREVVFENPIASVIRSIFSK